MSGVDSGSQRELLEPSEPIVSEDRTPLPPPPPPGSPPDSSEPSRGAPPVAGADPNPPPVAAPPPEIRRQGMHRSGALLGSAIAHLIAALLLALLVMPSIVKRPPEVLLVELPGEETAPPQMEMDIEAELRAASETDVFSAVSVLGSGGPAAGGGETGAVSLDQKMVDQAGAKQQVDIGGLATELLDTTTLIAEVPDGALGDPRAIVDDYDQAMDRLTQEIVWMLSRSNVLLIWCFDQSESMKDDQQEIRERIHRVYQELGLRGQANDDALTTAITSYGAAFAVHTRRPTSDVDEIRAAIEAVPIDPSGKEMMCGAIQASLAGHASYAAQTRRQMALVLVTDETGETEANIQSLEATIAAARQTRCRIYTLGREAVFGYPFAHMKWKHPFTGRVHWLPINRGPETAFVQQLQTDGFRRRYDAHPSGFGPYEQARLARETGGIFFMLPSLETNLVRGEKRRYELEAMRAYRPDLRHRTQILADRDGSEIRRVLWKIINDLNPYDERVADVMELRFTFSARPETFVKQVRQEQLKVQKYLVYLDAAAVALRELKPYRDQEYAPRWQANYDLVRAQVIAYSARTYEYAAYLEKFVRQPKLVPLEKPNLVRLSHWDMQVALETVGGDVTEPYISEATSAFQAIQRDHPGTPWSARAEQELTRGYGWRLLERYSYYGPRKSSPRPTPPQIPIPKL